MGENCCKRTEAELNQEQRDLLEQWKCLSEDNRKLVRMIIGLLLQPRRNKNRNA